ncbi:MAG: LytR C-terminal domain-containing protein [Candidatus Pacebacteria bacterium]|nr:LytR C-terminal domain-containing protein [Candidatus Paceibacterota bacterium]
MAETSRNFIYLLPDVAYVVELVKVKDSDLFKVRDYLQINGNFMDENDILAESIKKLSTRIQPKDYELVLPDFLFTNTMVNVKETGTEKVLEHVNKEIIPDLGISEKTHELKVFVLNEFKGQARVQLSALEKTVLKPLTDVFPEGGELKINNVYPLSWVTKSLISLEPSISVVQMGAKLYMAQHYIGIDQANDAEIEDVDKLIESIKTLKGAEPSIQTVYLLANALVESKLGDGLKGTLPVQQLAKDDEESEMPSYIKQVAEAAVKSIDIKEYQIPSFIFSGVDGTVEVIGETLTKEKLTSDDVKDEVVLPPPTELGTTANEDLSIVNEELDTEPEKTKEVEASSNEVAETKTEEEPTVVASTEVATEKETMKIEDKEPTKTELETVAETTTEVKEKTAILKTEDKQTSEVKEVDLRQFMSEETTEPKAEVKETVVVEKVAEQSKKQVIKNDTGINNMVKMVFVALVSFFITVGIGLGIGLGFLTFTNNQQANNNAPQTPVAEVSPTAEPTIEPTSEPIDRTKYSVLVVNATTKAGYAGEIATVLEEAGFEDVTAANAKGDYDEGNFVLADTEEAELLKTLASDTDLTFSFLAEKEVEDSADRYDFVIVLAE